MNEFNLIPKMGLNPFQYGNPVTPTRHIGREDLLRYLLSRICTMQSTAVVGLPRVGKTSLLLRLANIWRVYLPEPDCYAFIYLDCHMMAGSQSIVQFWASVLNEVREALGARVRSTKTASLLHQPISVRGLEKLFQSLADEGLNVVLLIDEFDTLLAHPNFRTADFFGLLRSLASRAGSLALVTTGRLSVAEMNRRTNVQSGSPFFNFLIERRLRAFAPAQIDQLLDRYLGESRLCFGENERRAIKRFSGGHPFLVQGWAALYYEQLLAGDCVEAPDEDGALFSPLRTYCADLMDLLPRPLYELLNEIALDKSTAAFNGVNRRALLRELQELDLIEPATEPQAWRVRSSFLGEFLQSRAPSNQSQAPHVNEGQHDVFLHALEHGADRQWLREVLRPALEQRGLRVHDADQFHPSVPPARALEQAVKQCRYTVAVLSEAYLTSCFSEFGELMAQHLGAEQRRYRLMTVLREPCTPRLRLNLLSPIDLSLEAQREALLDRLAAALRQEPPQA